MIAFLQAQGYVRPASGNDEWMTTLAGESISGAKALGFTRESAEQALAALNIYPLNMSTTTR